MKKLILTYCIFLGFLGAAPIVNVSIPKGGTHLIMKCLEMLTGKESRSDGIKYWDIEDLGFEKYFSTLHFHVPRIAHARGPEWKMILNIRDPRDVVVSFVNRSFKPALYKLEDWGQLPYEQKISYILNYNESIYYVPLQFAYFFETLSNNPDACVVKFENLVGAKGGGSDKLQFSEIRKIADYLEIEISEEKIKSIAQNLFGGTETFKKGKIGLWKESFTEEQKEKAKELFGETLIKLGYEEDLNW